MKQYKERIEQVLQSLMQATPIPDPQLKKAMHYALFTGGKRIRPLLVYACGELFSVPLSILDPLAACIELMHTYSLVHDDLPAMDNDDFRRGQPTCHRVFPEGMAILVGDGLQTLSFTHLVTALENKISAGQILNIIKILGTACGPAGMVSGQSLDLYPPIDSNPDVAFLTQIHQLKTGKLISACIDMVLTVSHPPQNETQALKDFAFHLGILFQIQDDYLDYYHCEQHGKNRCSDAANQKHTFATFYSKTELSALIPQHIIKTEQALTCFHDRSQLIMQFLQTIKKRIE